MATTTNYSWNTPDNTAYVKDGASAIRTLGSSVDTTLFTALGGAYPGLRLVKTQAIGTAVSSVNVTGAFSSTYAAYKVIVTGGVASTNNFFNFRLGATTTGYRYQLSGGNFTTTAQLQGSTAGAAFIYVGSSTVDGLSLNADIVNPQLAKITSFSAPTSDIGSWAGTTTGVLVNTLQYTDFTLLVNSGTITGGTIYVYGYGAS